MKKVLIGSIALIALVASFGTRTPEPLFLAIFLLASAVFLLLSEKTAKTNEDGKERKQDGEQKILLNQFKEEIDSYFRGISKTESGTSARRSYVDNWQSRLKQYWCVVLGEDVAKNYLEKERKNYF